MSSRLHLCSPPDVVAQIQRRQSVLLDHLGQRGDERADAVAVHVLRVERLGAHLTRRDGHAERVERHPDRRWTTVGFGVRTAVELTAIRREDVRNVHRGVGRVGQRQLARSRRTPNVQVRGGDPASHRLTRATVTRVAHLDAPVAQTVQPLERRAARAAGAVWSCSRRPLCTGRSPVMRAATRRQAAHRCCRAAVRPIRWRRCSDRRRWSCRPWRRYPKRRPAVDRPAERCRRQR